MKIAFRVMMIGILAFSILAVTAATADVTGIWLGSLTDPHGNKHDLAFNLQADGTKVTGTVTGGETQPITEGKIEGDQIILKVSLQDQEGKPFALVYEGKINGNQIQGTMTGSAGNKLPFTVARKQ